VTGRGRILQEEGGASLSLFPVGSKRRDTEIFIDCLEEKGENGFFGYKRGNGYLPRAGRGLRREVGVLGLRGRRGEKALVKEKCFLFTFVRVLKGG